jgi:hypothetical protein
MRASAETKTGDRRVIEYILSPVMQAVKEAGGRDETFSEFISCREARLRPSPPLSRAAPERSANLPYKLFLTLQAEK